MRLGEKTKAITFSNLRRKLRNSLPFGYNKQKFLFLEKEMGYPISFSFPFIFYFVFFSTFTSLLSIIFGAQDVFFFFFSFFVIFSHFHT
jgi:hypothetical protein